MVEGTTFEQSQELFRQSYRAEGRAAHDRGIPLARCYYADDAFPHERWEVHAATEWKIGWHDHARTALELGL